MKKRNLLLLSLFCFFLQAMAQPVSAFPEAPSPPLTQTEILVRYLRIPSVSGQERPAGEFLRGICEDAGLYIQQFDAPDGTFNFAASLYPLQLQKPNLIFLNHLDVVPAGEEAQWQHPPYAGHLVDNEIWGRGAFDNKGVAVMQLSAVTRFMERSRREDLPFNVTFLAVSCEETQCEGGARYVAQNHLAELNPWAVIGEGPPSLDGVVSSDPERLVFGIATGHKRPYWVKLDLTVPTNGHGSVTPLEYANQAMVTALEKLLSRKRKAVYTPENLSLLRDLGRLEGGVKGFVLKRPRLFRPLIVRQLRKQPEVFALFSNTVTLTNLSNPTTAHNVIPEKVTGLLDCRLLPQTDERKFLEQLNKRLGHEGITAEIVMRTPPATCSSLTHPVFGLLRASLLDHFGAEAEVVPLLLPNFNDSGWFRAAGIPAFDLTPARVSREHLFRVHGYNERISVTALHEGAAVFTRFLEKIMAEKGPKKLILADHHGRKN